MRILITGAGGLLGAQCAALASGRHECRGLTRHELDVTDRDAVDRAFGELEPEAVLHCAAFTDVDGAEREPARAFEVNARGAEIVARASAERGALMVYVSTDYVFDGTKPEPYGEDDPLEPQSWYGKSKLAGEREVAAALPGAHLIVRTAWLYGAAKGFPGWVRGQIERGTALRLVSDQIGSPTYAPDAAAALLALVEGDHRGVFHVVNRGQTSWLGLGLAVAEILGRSDVPVQAVTRAELARAAPRPQYSVLSVEKFEKATGRSVAPWRDALERYLRKPRQAGAS